MTHGTDKTNDIRCTSWDYFNPFCGLLTFLTFFFSVSQAFIDEGHLCMNWLRLKQENEILTNEIVEKMKSVEREKSEFIESHLAERRNEIDKLKEHHRFLRMFRGSCWFYWALSLLEKINNEMIRQQISNVWEQNKQGELKLG